MDTKPGRNSKFAEGLRIVIAGGGTGGHLYPGLALAETFRALRPGAQIVFVGTARGIEARVVPEHGYQLVLIPVRGLVRRMTFQNLLFPFRLAWSIGRCVLFFRKFQPHLVIGSGGYVSGPALTAARLCKIRRVVQEQNSYPGLVNRRLGPKVDAVFLTFEGSRAYFRRQKNLFVFGNPIRRALGTASRAEAASRFGLSSQRKSVLIFGGSQGARNLNELIAGALPAILSETPYQALWIVGPAWLEKWRALENRWPGRCKIAGYVNDMAAAYALADLAVCRAGATTIAELVTAGIPAIYIPFPFATADHQTANARAVAAAGGGLILPEKDLTSGTLAKKIKTLCTDEKRLKKMAAQARKLSMRNAARQIASKCLELIGEVAPAPAPDSPQEQPGGNDARGR